MEGGRQIDVAREILTDKNVPYVVSAPLLIQGNNFWYILKLTFLTKLFYSRH